MNNFNTWSERELLAYRQGIKDGIAYERQACLADCDRVYNRSSVEEGCGIYNCMVEIEMRSEKENTQ